MGTRRRPVNMEGATTHSRLRAAVSECWRGRKKNTAQSNPILLHCRRHGTFITAPFMGFEFIVLDLKDKYCQSRLFDSYAPA